MNEYMETLSKNCAKLVKYAAVILFALSLLGSILLGIIVATTAPDTDTLQAFLGIALIFVGPVASLFPALLTYGFGCLIENTDKILLAVSAKQ